MVAGALPGFVAAQPSSPFGDRSVSATIVPGAAAPPPATPLAPPKLLRSGDVSLNYPNADARAVAKAVLGDLLGLPFTIGPDVHVSVSVVTPRPIARADVLTFVEAAFATSGLAVANREGVLVILPTDQARAVAPAEVSSGQPGFATETIPLRFVNADEFRRLIDPVLPGVIVQADPGRNVIVIAGASGQRAALRDLVRQFDVDWLRNMSFALFVPQRTDSRLIVPELDKLINANGAPTKGMVRLIAMDRLNGILAITTQRQYLADVQRWVEVLDREGESSERRIYVYRVQNGRSADLAKVLANAFAGRSPDNGRNDRGANAVSRDDLNLPPTAPPSQSGMATAAPTSNLPTPPGQLSPVGGSFSSETSTPNGASSGQPVSVDIATDGLHAKISSDETNNAIIVYATPRDYAVVEDALRRLDVVPTQVLIEAAIVEVTLNDNLRYGVQWSFNTSKTNSTLSQDATGALTRNFPGFSFLYANGNSIQATVDALENLTKIKVVSAPKLTVLNNQTASLQVGDQVPIIAASAISTVGTNAPIINQIDYHDIGIILKITPRVNSSGAVLLDMSQEVSDVIPPLSSGINSPSFSTRRIATSVSVQDGQMVALGGLFSNSTTKGKSGLPYISRIPVLGALFGNVDNTGARTELIVLLQPHVLRGPSDDKAMTDELREKLKSLRELLPTSGMP